MLHEDQAGDDEDSEGADFREREKIRDAGALAHAAIVHDREGTDHERHEHRARDATRRILDLLGDVTARLEAVEDPDRHQAGREEGA